MGFSFGKSKNRQSSSTEQSIWEQQAPFLQSLYERGSELLGQQMGGPDFAQSFQAPAFSAWQQMLNPQENPQLAQMVTRAQELSGQNFARTVLPALNQSAISSGNLGGSRGGIAAGMAGEEEARVQGDIATQMYGRSYDAMQNRINQALQMTGGLAGLGGQSWSPLLAYANVLGRPTVLTESESKGKTDQFNMSVWGSASGGGSGQG